MKLGMILEVDETFTTIWLSRSSEVRVKVRRWPQSPPYRDYFLQAGCPFCCPLNSVKALLLHYLAKYLSPFWLN